MARAGLIDCLLDGVFASFRWYRRWVGGRWSCVSPFAAPTVQGIWVRGDPATSEHLEKLEEWPT